MIERPLLLSEEGLTPRRLWAARTVLLLGLATVGFQITQGGRIIGDQLAIVTTVVGTLTVYVLGLNALAVEFEW